ncbi:MAG: aldehyde dehydrogenase family protein, partial [Acetobacteraceae bacterium]
LLIAPFNDPLAGLARKIGPALAAGCPVLLKPSPLGMLVAVRLVSALPQPARRLVHLLAVPEPHRIARLVADPRVAIVSFTGSTAAGRAVAAAAAAGPKPAIMELGGNCPMVVLAGADLAAAAEAAVARKLSAAGQACSAINRILVADTVLDTFRAHLCAAMAAVRAGAPDDVGARYGPVRTAASAARLQDLARRAVARGERLIHGDLPASAFTEDEPFLVQPVILESSTGASVLDAEEAFGPMLSLQPVDTPRLQVRLRAERQPLAAYIFGPDDEANALARTLRFGSVGINTTAIQGTDVPMGGFDAAGFGREGGRWAVSGFRTTRNIRHARSGRIEGSVRRLSAEGVPESTSPVSNGTAAAGLVFVGGQMPRDPGTGAIVSGAEAQARLSLDHALAVAARGGARPQDVLLAIVYVTDLSAKPSVNAAFRARFGDTPPARNLVAVREIGEGAIVEVGLIARASIPR